MSTKLVWVETATGKTWQLIDLDGGVYGRIDFDSSERYLGYYADRHYYCATVSFTGRLLGFDYPQLTLARAKNAVRNQVKRDRFARDAQWRALA